MMPEAHLHFVTHVLRGKRFEHHTLPIDVLRELEAYQDLIIELAKELFLEKYPGRKRVPKGFVDSFRLSLERIDPGSTAPVLVRSPRAIDAELPGISSPDAFDEARDLTAECINSIANDSGVPARFPRALLPKFNNFGQSLLPDESIELHSPGSVVVAKYTKEVRKRLVLLTESNYRAPADITGKVCAADVKRQSFEIETEDGRVIGGRFPSSFKSVITSALHNHTRSRVRVVGTGVYDGNDCIECFDSITDVSPTDENSGTPKRDIDKRIAELGSLQKGWLDGEGLPIDPQGLKRLSELLRRLIDEDGFPGPYIYPTVEGGVQLEWSFGDWEVSAKLDFETNKVSLFAAHTRSEKYTEREIDSREQNDVLQELENFLVAFIPKMESGA
jgi:hypothetical protein